MKPELTLIHSPEEVAVKNEKIPSAETTAANRRAPRSVRLRAKAGANLKFSFYIHLAVYGAVNLLLAFINLITTPLIWWCLLPILGWGFGLLIHAVVAFSLPDLFGLRHRMYQAELERQWGKPDPRPHPGGGSGSSA